MSVRIPAIFPSGRRRRARWLGGPSDGDFVNLLDEEEDYFTMYEMSRQKDLLVSIKAATVYRVPIRNGKLYFYERELVND